ncbi:uncharacterized protein G2W53_030582 [Senna tora]|uniref:Uncharacterized protein n=1 Tax=Senna tora TaxID=362788 RepID=A0A834T7H4_9FABA|nr:uncharacterized protein G2W53_030582 [Senna tora]
MAHHCHVRKWVPMSMSEVDLVSHQVQSDDSDLMLGGTPSSM